MEVLDLACQMLRHRRARRFSRVKWPNGESIRSQRYLLRPSAKSRRMEFALTAPDVVVVDVIRERVFKIYQQETMMLRNIQDGIAIAMLVSLMGFGSVSAQEKQGWDPVARCRKRRPRQHRSWVVEEKSTRSDLRFACRYRPKQE